MLNSGTIRAAGELKRQFSSAAAKGRLAGKVALITGGGGGIGAESSRLFANEGASVVVADLNEEAAERVAQEIRDGGGNAVSVGGNVSNADHMKRMVSRAKEKFGGLHVLFNNAGIMMSNDDDAVHTTEDVIDTTLAVNVKGVLLGCRYGIPAIKNSGGGAIVNTASFVAFMGAATPQIAYTASKGAVLALTRELAVIHAREGIRVNALCPGPLRTELLMKFLDSEAKRQRRLIHVPMGRFGEAAEMAKAALFLASDESSFMTGASLLVDGGLTAAYVTPE
ncbi:short-chain dehydrogenase_reductase SDR [Klebsormidium nitens]|uniref:Short-chain dehydrogenase_reductase SDR n=1 Tax=Klebsormidium nitens TaxID=105231 RepID=A0A1Y1HLZ6_KLENI|nr:short-chain dehydrogenase_reductase SDR [Klebsormidium nitens]|eukprot:GAQ78692.1 short-chain dehydrogenase_reductase SDR [Klebsormidium nitens]